MFDISIRVVIPVALFPPIAFTLYGIIQKRKKNLNDALDYMEDKIREKKIDTRRNVSLEGSPSFAGCYKSRILRTLSCDLSLILQKSYFNPGDLDDALSDIDRRIKHLRKFT